MAYCQCEHIAHYTSELTPQGKTGHAYGKSFVRRDLVEVTTANGTFLVCPECAKDCTTQFARV